MNHNLTDEQKQLLTAEADEEALFLNRVADLLSTMPWNLDSQELRRLYKIAMDARATVAELRGTLTFYSIEDNYESVVCLDGGHRARSALAAPSPATNSEEKS